MTSQKLLNAETAVRLYGEGELPDDPETPPARASKRVLFISLCVAAAVLFSLLSLSWAGPLRGFGVDLGAGTYSGVICDQASQIEGVLEQVDDPDDPRLLARIIGTLSPDPARPACRIIADFQFEESWVGHIVRAPTGDYVVLYLIGTSYTAVAGVSGAAFTVREVYGFMDAPGGTDI